MTPDQSPVRWSNLKYMARSAAHYHYYLDNPITPTPAMRLGTIVHQLVLGGNAHPLAVWPGTRRGKEWEAFRDEHSGVEIVTQAEMDTGLEIANAVLSHPEAARIIEDAQAVNGVEIPVEWEVGGRSCRGTPDCLSGPALADLKVTADASPERFRWHARKMLWPAQLAWYLDGCPVAKEPDRTSIIAVESGPPHVVTVFDLTDELLEVGRRTWRGLFERLMVCERTGLWPGYVEGVAVLDATEQEDALTLDIDGEEVVL